MPTTAKRGGGVLRVPGAKRTVPGGGKEADTLHTSGEAAKN